MGKPPYESSHLVTSRSVTLSVPSPATDPPNTPPNAPCAAPTSGIAGELTGRPARAANCACKSPNALIAASAIARLCGSSDAPVPAAIGPEAICCFNLSSMASAAVDGSASAALDAAASALASYDAWFTSHFFSPATDATKDRTAVSNGARAVILREDPSVGMFSTRIGWVPSAWWPMRLRS